MEYIVLANPPGQGLRLITLTNDYTLADSVAETCRTLLAGTEGMVILASVEGKWETKDE